MKKRGLGLVICVSGSCIAILIIIGLLIVYLSGGINLSPPEEQETYLACINNSCTMVEGVGVNECSPDGSFCGCIDTDLEGEHSTGMNFFMQGTTRNATISKTDICTPNGKVREYICQKNRDVLFFEVSCESLGNYTCVDGECFPDYKEIEDCKDTDGGLKYEVGGMANNGKVRISDYCTNDGLLAEVYCPAIGDEVLIDLFDCKTLGNYECQYGKCVHIG